MKKTIFCLLTCLILIITLFPTVNSVDVLKNNDIKIKNELNFCNGGWLEERDGIKILHLNGSYYDMGYQHGLLLKDEINSNINAFYNWIAEKGFTYEELLHRWNIMKSLLPHCYIEEMTGIADASGLSLENISVYNVGFYLVVNCGSFAVWGNSTIDGILYHARSHDLSIKLKDPVTGKYLVENQVIIIRKPLNQYPSISPSVAGMVQSSDGFNENEIAVGMLSSWSNDETFKGICIGFRIRMVLDYAASINEAIDILIANKTLGYNVIVSDGKIPISYAVETTANISYVGTWDNPSESKKPFWDIKQAIRRSNMFIDPLMAATQRNRYNPSLFPLLNFFLKINQMSGTSVTAAATWMHYVAISKGIQSEWSNLDLNNTMGILRNIYLGKTDIRFLILQILGVYSTPYQWVMCPKTGDFVLSFATRDKNAFENPVNYFNFYILLKSTPS